MRFPPQFLDELRARLPVSDVVGRRVKLRKAGREWKGLSPFGKERTPSFTVNDQKGFAQECLTVAVREFGVQTGGPASYGLAGSSGSSSSLPGFG